MGERVEEAGDGRFQINTLSHSAFKGNRSRPSSAAGAFILESDWQRVREGENPGMRGEGAEMHYSFRIIR